MTSSGFFITLYDTDTLRLYLKQGIYGFLMPPVQGEISSRSMHYHALADYSCGREGTHVFFFLKRHIVYGGQLIGSKEYGSFYLNGPLSPMGKLTKSKLSWDESRRYKPLELEGIFNISDTEVELDRCQPYLIKFEDKMGLKGNTILSDALYFELGSYPYPLPSNAIQDMSFCTLTPGEVDIMLNLMKSAPENLSGEPKDLINFTEEPLFFSPAYGIKTLSEATSESHLEASILANPNLLPPTLRPGAYTLCRQVPISPFKPSQMDRADVCYYSEDAIREGTIPNKVIEIKQNQAGKNEVLQVVRYAQWIRKVVPSDSHRVLYFLYAPSFSRGCMDYLPRDLRSQITLVPFNGSTLI